ncbi:MAG: hypothetical protein J0L66_06640 [Cytophagales bacterium]|nr:hypothetical protein [Cytophagales bacterium]
MRNLIILIIVIAADSCSTPAHDQAASKLSMPYVATYSSKFNQNVSEESVQIVLTSLKAWERGDMEAYRKSFADTVTFNSSDGSTSIVLVDALMDSWAAHRHDSLASMDIEVRAWTKLHSIDKNTDFVSLWFRAVDHYRNGRVDSIYVYEDYRVANAKIVQVDQYVRGPF